MLTLATTFVVSSLAAQPQANTITLVDAGKEPRQQLRYTLFKGSTFAIEVEAMAHSTDTDAAGKQTLDDTRGNRFTVEATVSRVMGDGSIYLSTRMTKLERIDAQGRKIETKGLEAFGLDMLGAASGTCIIGPDGRMRSAAVGDGSHANFTEIMFEPINFAFAPLPREQVGEKARWTTLAPVFRDTKITAPKAVIPDDVEGDTLDKAGDIIEITRRRDHAEAPESLGGSFLYDRTRNLSVVTTATTRLDTTDGLIPESALAVRTFDADFTVKGALVHSHISTTWKIKFKSAAPQPEPPKKADKPADPKFSLDLKAQGVEPRVVLASNPKPGDRAAYEAVIRASEGYADTTEPRPSKPGVWASVCFEASVKEVSPEETRCEVRVIAATLLNPDDLPGPQRQAIQDDLRNSIGKSYPLRLAPPGADPEKALPDDAPEFLAFLSMIQPPLPKSPVGRGARWTFNPNLPEVEGKKINSSTEFRLLAQTGDLWTLEKDESLFASEKTARGGPMTLSTSTSATIKIRPGALLPEELHETMTVIIKSSETAKLGYALKKQSSTYLIRKPDPAK